jgi:hypothetical protein
MRIINRFEEDLDTRHVISDAISAIFSAFDQKLEDLELEKLEVPMATELAMAKLHKLIDLATMAYDGIVNPEEIFERMTPDGEPYPDKIDSWARGIVTTRKVVVEEINFNKGSLTARSGTPSVSSYRSSATGKTRSSSASRTVRSLGSRGSDRDGKAQDATGQIIELDDPDNEFGDFNATGSMFEMLQRAVRLQLQYMEPYIILYIQVSYVQYIYIYIYILNVKPWLFCIRNERRRREIMVESMKMVRMSKENSNYCKSKSPKRPRICVGKNSSWIVTVNPLY